MKERIFNISESEIQNLVAEPYFSRGKEYYAQGMVELKSVRLNKTKAKVLGSRIYEVVINRKAGILKAECSCPAFDDCGPCKHISATCFALLNKDYRPGKYYDKAKEIFEDMEDFLKSKSKAKLISIIMQMLLEDPDLMETFCHRNKMDFYL